MARAAPLAFFLFVGAFFGCGGDDATTSAGPTDGAIEERVPDEAATGLDGAASSTEGGGANEADASTCVPVKAFQVSEEPGASLGLTAAWNGSGFGIAWTDTRGGNQQIYFARLDAGGKKIGADVKVTDITPEGGAGAVVDGGPSPFARLPRLAWTGTEYGLLWMVDGLWFERLDPSGKPTTPVLVGPALDGNARQMVWNGSGYGISWYDNHEGDFEIYLARLDVMGAKIGGDVRVTNSPGNSFVPSLVANGNGYGLAWHDNRADGGFFIYFSSLDAMGVETVDDVQVSTANGGGPRLAWAGDGYGVTWGGGGNVELARIDSSGKKVGPETLVTTGASPLGLAWTGRGFAIPQMTGAMGAPPLSLALTDATGKKVGADVVLSNTSSGVTSVAVLGTAGGAAVAWIESTASSTEVDFAVICP